MNIADMEAHDAWLAERPALDFDGEFVDLSTDTRTWEEIVARHGEPPF